MPAIWEQNSLPPYGYECDENGMLYLSEVEETVLNIIKVKQDKGQSLTLIAQFLNEQGYETRQGKKWNRHSVRRALNSNRSIILD